MAKTGYAPLRRKVPEETTTVDPSDDGNEEIESDNRNEADASSSNLGGIAEARRPMWPSANIDFAQSITQLASQFPAAVSNLSDSLNTRIKIPFRPAMDNLTNVVNNKMKIPNWSTVTNLTESLIKTNWANVNNFTDTLTRRKPLPSPVISPVVIDDRPVPEEVPPIPVTTPRAIVQATITTRKRKKPTKPPNNVDNDDQINANKKKQYAGMPWLLNLVGPPGNILFRLYSLFISFV